MLNAVRSFAPATHHHLLLATHVHCSGLTDSRRASFTYHAARRRVTSSCNHRSSHDQDRLRNTPPLSEAYLSGASVYCRRNLSIHSLSLSHLLPNARRLRNTSERIDQTPLNRPCPSNDRFEASSGIRLRQLEECNAILCIWA